MYRELGISDLDGEIWNDVLGFEDVYQVSNKGRVKTKQRVIRYDKGLGRGVENKTINTRIRKQRVNKHTGYLVVSLNSNGKIITRTIHSMVGEVFFGYIRGQGKDSTSNCMNHKDGNKLNNTVDNLECISIKDNINHAFNTGLGKSAHPVMYKGIKYRSKTQLRVLNKISEKRMYELINNGDIVELERA